MIEFKNVEFAYPTQPDHDILKKISFNVPNGKFVAILGSNGSGKSTLAQHMNALLLPNSGEVLIDGEDTRNEKRLNLIREKVGIVFQNPDNQIIGTNVEENLAFGSESRGIDPIEIQKRVSQALKMVDIEKLRLESIEDLSGGQKQKVAIASVFADQTKYLILDEPTAMLDSKSRTEITKTLNQLRTKYQITIVLITHNVEEALNCDKIVLLDQGTIVKQGTPVEIFQDVELLKNLNLNVPPIVQLGDNLIKRGLPIKTPILSITQLNSQLKVLRKNGFKIDYG